ncbi:hypothetical protein Dfri01_39150 [Dyadobacter frigoris]|uniref:hypothetical protein n=1 Tax=Dyadobacter frigoris TaxID=2576211 RepID=UPI0024A5D07C|nr:hypothetical protein [Dyadobacter frigoris]GLU54454.1 hypothetical protein Dfri01_39150 [Dyadobacter frigoris]
MATEFTIEQFKEWVNETFPDNLARAIVENNLRDGLAKMADFVFETNSSTYIQNSLAKVNQSVQDADIKRSATSQLFLDTQAVYLATIALKNLMQTLTDQAAIVGPPLGDWNPGLNTQGLVALPPAGAAANSVYEIVADGIAPFAGIGFAAGDLLLSGGRLFKKSTQWFYQKPSSAAYAKAISLEEKTAGMIGILPDGFYASDLLGNVIFEITDKVRYTGQVTQAMLDAVSAKTTNFLDLFPNDIYITDPNGNVAFEIVSGVVNYTGKASGSSGASVKLDGEFASDWVHFIMDGQSLSKGGTATTAIDFYDAKTFAGGLQTDYDPADTAARDIYYGSGLINLPTTGTDSGKGLIKIFKDLIRDENGIAAADQAFTPILNSGGISGAGWSTLSDVNGMSYKRIIESVKYAQDFAIAAGKSYSVPVMTYIQGENSGDRDDTITEWYTKLETLFNSFNTDIKAITGQKFDIQFIIYQIASGISAPNFLGVPLAQLKIAQEKTNVHFGNAMYQMTYADALHLDNPSYRMMWAMQGVAAKRIVVDKKKMLPIYPLSWYINKNQASTSYCIVMKMNVPSGKLAFDETINSKFTTAPTNKGFSIKNAGSAEIITNVTISRGNTLNIFCSENPAGLEMSYAAQGRVSGGNLRDSQGDKITISFNGVVYPVHNWCPIFKQII